MTRLVKMDTLIHRMPEGGSPTCLGLHGEVWLPVDDAVDHPGAVPVRGVVRVRGCHLHHHGSCEQTDLR